MTLTQFSERFQPLRDAEGSGSGAPAGSPSTPAAPGGEGGSTTPSSPSSPSTPSPAEAGTSYEGLGAFHGDDEDFVEVTKSPVPPEPTPAPTATGAQAPQAPAPQPQAQQPAPAPAAQPPANAGAASEAPHGPRGLVEQLEQHRNAILEKLAQDRFKVTPEEADAVVADPVNALPKLMARVYYQAQQSTLLAIDNHVPRMVMQLVRDMKLHDDAENAFYANNKALDRAKHHDDVLAFARSFRQMDPKITLEDLQSMIVAAVMSKHKLPAVPATNGAHPGQVLQQVGAPQSAAPFVPARPGVGGVRVTTQPDTNAYAGLGKWFDDE